MSDASTGRASVPAEDPLERGQDPYESLRALLVVEERICADRLAAIVSAAGPRDSAVRAISGIVLDTIDEKNALEEIVREWASAEVVNDVPIDARSPEFRELVASLLDVKRAAARRYRSAGRHAPTLALCERLEALARQASEHAAILLAISSER